MIFPGVLSFFQVFQVEWEPWGHHVIHHFYSSEFSPQNLFANFSFCPMQLMCWTIICHGMEVPGKYQCSQIQKTNSQVYFPSIFLGFHSFIYHTIQCHSFISTLRTMIRNVNHNFFSKTRFPFKDWCSSLVEAIYLCYLDHVIFFKIWIQRSVMLLTLIAKKFWSPTWLWC